MRKALDAYQRVSPQLRGKRPAQLPLTHVWPWDAIAPIPAAMLIEAVRAQGEDIISGMKNRMEQLLCRTKTVTHKILSLALALAALALNLSVIQQAKAGSFTNTGSLTTARMDATATLLTNGQVLVAGGGGPPGWLSSAELYDPASGTWTNTGSLMERDSVQV